MPASVADVAPALMQHKGDAGEGKAGFIDAEQSHIELGDVGIVDKVYYEGCDSPASYFAVTHGLHRHADRL